MSIRGWFLALTGVLAASWFWLWRNFHLVPDPMPTHFGWSGADAWSAKSLTSAFVMVGLGPIILGVTGLVVIGLTHAVAQDAGERQRMLARGLNPAMARFTALLGMVIAVAVTTGLLGWAGGLSSLLLTVALVAVCVDFGVRVVRHQRRVNEQFPPGERERRTRLGFYYNPDDPELIVSLENGMNTTLNFARPGAWAVIAGLLAVPTLLVILGLLAG